MIKYWTTVWNEEHSFGGLYNVVRNGAASANSTHQSHLSDPQRDLNVSLYQHLKQKSAQSFNTLLDAAVPQNIGDKRWEYFLLKKVSFALGYFTCCCPTLQGKGVFLGLGTKPFPPPLPRCSATYSQTGSGIGTTGEGREANICLGTGCSVPALVNVSQWHEQPEASGLRAWSKPNHEIYIPDDFCKAFHWC